MRPLSLTDVCRNVLKQLASQQHLVLTYQQVHSVFKCIGHFVNHVLKSQEVKAAEISGFGVLMRCSSSSSADVITFRQPSVAVETDKVVFDKTLTTARMARFCQLTEANVTEILKTTESVLSEFTS